MSNYVVFRSDNNVRAVQVEIGQGVPEDQQMREDEYYAMTIEGVETPDHAVWKAALKCHQSLVVELVRAFVVYFDLHNWDRGQIDNPETVDYTLGLLRHFVEDDIDENTKLELGLVVDEIEANWPEPEPEPVASEVPGQLSFLP
jgi:hypothetical protein